MFVFINSYLPPPAPNEEKKAGNAKIKKLADFSAAIILADFLRLLTVKTVVMACY